MKYFKPWHSQNSSQLFSLQIELAEYGLSPDEWIIKKQNKYSYQIRHKEDPQFYFNGETKINSGTQKWKSIVLKGI